MNEILNPTTKTYWLITDGNGYITGETNPGQQTSVGKGWSLLYITTDQQDFVNFCDTVGVTPQLTNKIISSRQIRLWLIQNGISLQNVIDAINSVEDQTLRDSLMVEWEYAPYVERNHPMLPAIAQSLGFGELDIDRAFTEGSAI